MTVGVPPVKNDHVRSPRGECVGWSDAATRRNTAFLRSIEDTKLTGFGLAVTFTLRDCPPTADAWHRLRRSMEHRLRRLGMLRMHWVTEWQRRGVPHLHGAIWFPGELHDYIAHHRVGQILVDHWCEVAKDYGAEPWSQTAHLVTGAVGWFQYVSKHASRGVKHYQRSPENVPPAWQRKTGRVWGKVGDWPVRDAIAIKLEGHEGDRGFYAYRRLVRSWRVAEARASGSVARLKQARGMLRCGRQRQSAVRGASEWLPYSVTLQLLLSVASRGFNVSDYVRQPEPAGAVAGPELPADWQDWDNGWP